MGSGGEQSTSRQQSFDNDRWTIGYFSMIFKEISLKLYALTQLSGFNEREMNNPMALFLWLNPKVEL